MAAGCAVAAIAGTAAPAAALTLPAGPVAARTNIAIINNDGQVSATAGAEQPGPALSLAKLYLGYWVLAHGDVADKAVVPQMIRFSDDGIAARLDSRYPTAIGDVMRDFGLRQSHPGPNWGFATTSMMDGARFLQQIRLDPVAAPMIQAMATAAPVAADGYHQDFGTSRIPGVWATKYGWSDEGDVNATASFGPDYVIVARTYGPPQQLTADLGGLVGPPAPMANAGMAHANTANADTADAQVVQMPWLGGNTPALTGAAVQQQVRCADPLGLSRILPATALVPKFFTDLLPHCR